MNRKRFLLLTAMVAAGTAAGGPWLLESSPPDHAPLRPAFLAALFSDAELIRLGLLYRMQYPAESTVHGVLSRLLDGSELHRLTPSNPAVARQLAARVADDFRTGRTVDLDGWVLSRTEARQCVLLSLLA